MTVHTQTYTHAQTHFGPMKDILQLLYYQKIDTYLISEYNLCILRRGYPD